jgi:hypothetical protein
VNLPPITRDSTLHTARVYLAESRNRLAMGHRGFAFTLLEWAGNARRRAAAMPRHPQQVELF